MAISMPQTPSHETYENELQQAWRSLLSAGRRSSTRSECSVNRSTDGAQLDYVQYCQAAAGCESRLAGHLTASAFLRFRRSAGGSVSAAAVHEYLSRRTAMLELWQRLAAFDEAGGGALTGDQLAAFITSLAAELPALQGLERNLSLGLYAAIAAHKLLFFHGRAGRVRIRDLVLSPVLAELLQLPAPGPPHPAAPPGGPDTSTENIHQSYIPHPDVHMIQHPLRVPGRLLNGNASSSDDDGKSGGNMADAQQHNRVPLPAIGPKLPPWEPLNGSFVKAVLAEFVCTTAFLFIVIGHVTFSCHASDVGQGGGGVAGGEVGAPTSCLLTEARVLSIATVFGLTIGILVYASASFSGGHLNPAITMGCLCTKKVTAQRAVCYWAAQISGAILGSLFPYLIDRNAWHAANGGTNSTAAVPGMHDSAVWAMEALLTAVLVFVVFAATDARRASLEAHIPVLAPFAIGFTVFVCHLVAVPIDGCSINPARSFGPAVISGIWVGPLSGAVVHCGVLTSLFLPCMGNAMELLKSSLTGGIFGAFIYEVFFRLSRDEDDTKGKSGTQTPQPGDDEEAAKHLADFSGYDGHTDHDKPGTDEMLLPPYGGLQGAGSNRHQARGAIHPVVVEAAGPHPAVDGAASSQPQGALDPTPHSFRGRTRPLPPPSVASV